MSIRDVVSWRSRSPLARGGRVEHPMVTLQREMNRVFDDLFQGFEAGPVFGDAVGLASQAWPQMDIIDGEEAVRVIAELPGMAEEDVELTLEDGILTLRGERHGEKQGEGERQYTERFHGRFERRIRLGQDIDEEKIEAQFDQGVLTITLPRSQSERPRVRKISLKGRD